MVLWPLPELTRLPARAERSFLSPAHQQATLNSVGLNQILYSVDLDQNHHFILDSSLHWLPIKRASTKVPIALYSFQPKYTHSLLKIESVLINIQPSYLFKVWRKQAVLLHQPLLHHNHKSEHFLKIKQSWMIFILYM